VSGSIRRRKMAEEEEKDEERGRGMYEWTSQEIDNLSLKKTEVTPTREAHSPSSSAQGSLS